MSFSRVGGTAPRTSACEDHRGKLRGFKSFRFFHIFITHLTFSKCLVGRAMIETIFNTRELEEMLLIITPGNWAWTIWSSCIQLFSTLFIYLFRSDFFPSFSNWSIVDTECYISFRRTTDSLDKSLCYAMLTAAVATICHHRTLLRYRWLYSPCRIFHPHDLFLS